MDLEYGLYFVICTLIPLMANTVFSFFQVKGIINSIRMFTFYYRKRAEVSETL